MPLKSTPHSIPMGQDAWLMRNLAEEKDEEKELNKFEKIIKLVQNFWSIYMQTSEQIKLFASAIMKKVAPKTIILFGSQALGNTNKESDIDICIITDLKDRRKIDIIRDIRRASIPIISLPLDILVYDEKEFAERAGLKSTLEYKINTQGKRIRG
jgi:predicted nucleotidyltransferase